MKKIFPILLICSLILNGILIIQELRRSVVGAVPDGDTIDLSDGRRVRLLGLDAPEMGRCGSIEARDRLRELVMNKRMRLKDIEKDSYGRVLANVINDDFLDGGQHASEFLKRYFGLPHKTPLSKNAVNRAMVEEGLARYEGSGTEQREVLKQASEQAKTSKLGIYSSICLQADPPDKNCPIKGNIRNGDKTYHLPGCDNYDQTTVSLSFGDQWFCDETSASAAGFEKAAGCR